MPGVINREAGEGLLGQFDGLQVIASGGVRSMQDILAARQSGLAGIILGRALYEGNVDLKSAFLHKASNE